MYRLELSWKYMYKLSCLNKKVQEKNHSNKRGKGKLYHCILIGFLVGSLPIMSKDHLFYLPSGISESSLFRTFELWIWKLNQLLFFYLPWNDILNWLKRENWSPGEFSSRSECVQLVLTWPPEAK